MSKKQLTRLDIFNKLGKIKQQLKFDTSPSLTYQVKNHGVKNITFNCSFEDGFETREVVLHIIDATKIPKLLPYTERSNWIGTLTLKARYYAPSEIMMGLVIRGDGDFFDQQIDLYDHSEPKLFALAGEINQIASQNVSLPFPVNYAIQPASPLFDSLLSEVSQKRGSYLQEAHQLTMNTIDRLKRIGSFTLFQALADNFQGSVRLRYYQDVLFYGYDDMYWQLEENTSERIFLNDSRVFKETLEAVDKQISEKIRLHSTITHSHGVLAGSNDKLVLECKFLDQTVTIASGIWRHQIKVNGKTFRPARWLRGKPNIEEEIQVNLPQLERKLMQTLVSSLSITEAEQLENTLKKLRV